MTLRARLILSAFVLSLATTFALAFIVRNAWKNTEALRFQEESQITEARLKEHLGTAAANLKQSLSPLCQHDPIVDSALVGLSSNTLSSRLLSLRARVPELKKSLDLDELALVTSKGALLAGDYGDGHFSPREIASQATSHTSQPRFRDSAPRAFVGACTKKEGGLWVALIGAKYLTRLLEESSSQDLTITVEERDSLEGHERASVEGSTSLLEHDISFDFLPGQAVRLSRDRSRLLNSLRDLDVVVFTAMGGTLLGALLLAFFLSRGLARPIVQFAEKTRLAVTGKVQELPVSGGPELEQAARAFNETLQDLHALQERLQVTERIAARREVARQIAHEIKNPLSPIRTSIETLRKMHQRGHPDFDEYFQETTVTVLEEVMRISHLASNFAEYARLPAPRLKEIDLVRLCDKIIGLHQDLGVPLSFETQSEIPLALADADQIAQVLTNLIKNAIEEVTLLDAPEVNVSLSVVENSDNKWLELTVSDNGDGVKKEHLSKLFEPYATTKKEGTGLGLPISHRIAVEHGGDLTYTTSENGGARFVLLLPTFGPPSLVDEAG